jgi:dihydrodipicolinate reductase
MRTDNSWVSANLKFESVVDVDAPLLAGAALGRLLQASAAIVVPTTAVDAAALSKARRFTRRPPRR